MKKRKIFKTLAFSSLAVVMAAGGIFAFAPIGASASSPPPTTTTGLGLDPKNDPVVYTTESGLEIKMSNADKFSGTVTTTTNNGKTHTQDLTSFYYFTMGSFSGTIYTAKTQTETYTVTKEPVNWIILGVGSHSSAFIDSVSNYLFSAIKNYDYLFEDGEYFFGNQHETFSPAGQLIDSTISAKTYIMGKVKDSIVVNTDIPKGCMLVLSEKLLGSMYFNSSGNINTYWHTTNDTSYYLYGEGNYGNRYRFLGRNTTTEGAQSWTINGNAGGSHYNYINRLFSKNVSGSIIENGLEFSQAQADLIIPQQLYTFYSDGPNLLYHETPQTDGGTYYTMFPLAYRNSHLDTYQNFCIEDYLITDTQRTACFIGSSTNQSYSWRLRSGNQYNCHAAYIVYPSGKYDYHGPSWTYGVRPAMVMKLS